MNEGEKIAEAALSWLGTPHVNGAKSRGHGIDCGMLLIAATEDAGYIAKDAVKVAPYSNEWHLHHSDEKCSGQTDTGGNLLPPSS